MQNTLLFLTLLLLQGSLASHSLTSPTWDAFESVVETQNSTDSIPDPVVIAIEKATDNIRRDLAAELRAMFEELPNVVVQPTPPPLPARVVDVKEGQQLVFAADAGETSPPSPPRPPQRPRLPAVPPAALYVPPQVASPLSPASAPDGPASP